LITLNLGISIAAFFQDLQGAILELEKIDDKIEEVK
jgi:hypothetical protein